MWKLHTPSLTEDAKHMSVIVTTAIAAIAGTAAFFSAVAPEPPALAVEIGEIETHVAPTVDLDAGADRLFGTVTTVAGGEHTGYIRWNGREASWADVLPATALRGPAVAGLRFGHMSSIEPLDGPAVRVTLKSGESVDVAALPLERHRPLSPVVVESVQGQVAALEWGRVAGISFDAEPSHYAPLSERIHGTLITRGGTAFTGYVTWDLEETFLDEMLEGTEAALPFSAVASIQPLRGGVRVLTVEGASIDLSGTRDVDASNRGITIADPALGSVTVPIERVGELRLHRPEEAARYEGFSGGTTLRGTVVTEQGEALTGTVRWDRDEHATWTLLDGSRDGIEYHIEFSRLARVEKTWMGSTVELQDGRSFYLLASNDVNWTNKGIDVTLDDGSRRTVSWEEFRSVDFERAPTEYVEVSVF